MDLLALIISESKDLDGYKKAKMVKKLHESILEPIEKKYLN